VSPLAQFLIDRACCSPVIANFLYWYLKVEAEDEDPYGLLFRQIMESFLIQLASSPLKSGSLDQADSRYLKESQESKEKGGRDREKGLGSDIKEMISDQIHVKQSDNKESSPKDLIKDQNKKIQDRIDPNKDFQDQKRDQNRANNGRKSEEQFQGAECALQLYALNEYVTQIFECHNIARALPGRKDVKQAALRRLLAERRLENVQCRIEGIYSPFLNFFESL
jgi:hypothetical protein